MTAQPGTAAGPANTAGPHPTLPAAAQLLLLTNGGRVAQIVYALAELGVADAVAGGAGTVGEIAAHTGTDAEALRRILRCAATVGVFALRPDGRIEMTDMAEALRSDVPQSQRDMILFNGDPICSRPYGEIVTALRTGRPVFEGIFGAGFFTYLRQEPEKGELFDRAMSGMSARSTELLLGACDFGRFGSVVDVGGGRGHFLTRLLTRHPHVHGVLLDQAQVVAGVEQAGFGKRLAVVAGDFFEVVPGAHDAYVLKAVLHDWDDEDAVRILRVVRTAIGDRTEARLVVLEHVLSPGDRWDQGKFLDIDMMLRFGGRERDRAEWEAVLAEGGFALTTEPPAGGGWAALECRPV